SQGPAVASKAGFLGRRRHWLSRHFSAREKEARLCLCRPSPAWISSLPVDRRAPVSAAGFESGQTAETAAVPAALAREISTARLSRTDPEAILAARSGERRGLLKVSSSCFIQTPDLRHCKDLRCFRCRLQHCRRHSKDCSATKSLQGCFQAIQVPRHRRS